MLDKRVEILFAAQDFENLRQRARETGRSVGDLVREAVRRQYLAPSESARRQAVERLTADDLALDWPDWESLKREIPRQVESDFAPD